jgi:hypothetical protein
MHGHGVISGKAVELGVLSNLRNKADGIFWQHNASSFQSEVSIRTLGATHYYRAKMMLNRSCAKPLLPWPPLQTCSKDLDFEARSLAHTTSNAV